MNFALFRPAYQSSTLAGYEAIIAVDGIAEGDACSHTDTNQYPSWWKVWMAYPIWVNHVEITNRQFSGEYMVETFSTNMSQRVCI